MRYRLHAAAGCLAALVLSCASAQAELPFDFGATPGKLPKTARPALYTIDIVPDLKTLALTGHETIETDILQPGTGITLNQNGLAISRATLEDGSQAAIRTDDHAQTATLVFPHAIGAGRHVLTLDYTGHISEAPAGIYYDDYKTKSGASRRMLVTQFEVADARRMFPCWDEPVFKARFRLSAVLPSDLTAVSNMPAIARTPAGPGLSRVQFATTPVMSTYLLALLAGDLAAVRQKAGNTDIAVFSPSGEENEGRYALGAAGDLLPYYNSYFGVDYPLPKLDLIAVPGNYEAGAMENWGAITFIDDALLYDDRTSSSSTRETIYVDVAHEMAHQWSGDLVTMAWWDNIWLNEGFATWMEYKATDHFNPSWQLWPRQHEAREDAMAQDALPTTHPIQQRIRDESEADSAFDDISYQKGSQIIRMIEDWLGPDVFRDGMRAYMKAHAYSNATSADLWAALSKASGKDVGAVASAFTEQPGIPLVHVTRRCTRDGASLTLSQDRFSIHDPKAAHLSWTIPVSMAEPGRPAAHLLLASTPLTVKLDTCDAAEKANTGETGYYRVQYDAGSLRPIMAHFAEFGAADRANLLGDQFAMFLSGRAPLSSYLDMLPALRGETNIAVWDDTLDHLTELDSLMHGNAARPAFRAFARALVQPEFARLGWDGRPGDSFPDTLLRPRLITALGRFDDPAVIAGAQTRFQAFASNPASLAANLREPVLMIVGHHADQATYDMLRRMGEAAPGTEEKLRYFRAMAAAQDPQLIARTMQYAATGQIPDGRIPMIVNDASFNADNPDAVWRLMQPAQTAIRKHLTDQGQAMLLPAAAASSASAVVARALVSDPASHASIGAKIAAARVADAINTRAELQQRAAPAVAVWLKDHHDG